MRVSKLGSLFLGVICFSLIMGCDDGGRGRKKVSPSTGNKRIFVTQGSYDGNLLTAANNAGASVTTGIQGADYLCMNDANKPSTGTFKALIVDHATGHRIACTTAFCGGGAAEHVDWVLSANSTYYRVDGTTVIGTTNASGIFDFTADLQNSMSATSSDVWTGLFSNWSTRSYDCNGWDGTGTEGDGGNSGSTSVGSVSFTWSFCAMDTASLICVEQ